MYRTTFNFFQDNDASTLNQSDPDPNLLSILSHHLSHQTRADPPSTRPESSTSSTSQGNRENNSTSSDRNEQDKRCDADGTVEYECD